ncbi:MAG: amidophosphoribosyltransferase [Fibrobacteres bacterium]|nr:amidophosphoribosyltransferase [Fibrobacterota bacterium]
MGVFGGPEVTRRVVMGLYSLQHRGQESVGVATTNGETIHVLKRMGLVTELNKEEKEIESMTGIASIGHVRYSTTGNSNINNAQPMLASTKRGPIAVAHNGNIVNAPEIRKRMEEEGSIFQSTSDTEIILHLIARSQKTTLVEAITETLVQLTGSFCLVFLTDKEIYVARDGYGIRPLCMGRLDKTWVVASETCALDLLGASYVRDIKPGELCRINDNGLESTTFTTKPHRAHCIFEFVYFSRPDSRIFEESCDKIRRKIGKALAKEHPTQADVVVSVPDSSNTAALGYAQEAGINFDIGLLRNHYVGRTFIDPSQNVREQKVKLKFNTIAGVLKNKRVVLVDDSIVRGTTLKFLTKMLRDAGAKEVHIRISSPPVMNPCYYGMDFPSKTELIASNLTKEETRKLLGADTLEYLSIKGLLGVAPGGAENYCAACFDGKYPEQIPAGSTKFRCE